MAESNYTLEGSRTIPTGGAMLQKDVLIVDYGPRFQGTVVGTDDGIVCVVPSRLQPRSEDSKLMRELVESHGGTCGLCEGCPLGRLN